jgi:hypothetical protein
MPRRLTAIAGALLAGAGLLAGVASLAVPWGRYQVHGTAYPGLPVGQDGPVPVFLVPGGSWYLAALGVLAALLAVAAFGTGRAPRLALTVAPVLGMLTAFLVIALANAVAGRTTSLEAAGLAKITVIGQTAGGIWIGLVAGPLLGFGAAALALSRAAATPDPGGAAPAAADA